MPTFKAGALDHSATSPNSFYTKPLGQIPLARLSGGQPVSMLTRVNLRAITLGLNHLVLNQAPVTPVLDKRGRIELPFGKNYVVFPKSGLIHIYQFTEN